MQLCEPVPISTIGCLCLMRGSSTAPLGCALGAAASALWPHSALSSESRQERGSRLGRGMAALCAAMSERCFRQRGYLSDTPLVPCMHNKSFHMRAHALFSTGALQYSQLCSTPPYACMLHTQAGCMPPLLHKRRLFAPNQICRSVICIRF
ncbi:hypothetical protein GQ54DRAFT_190962 [Martensiomyces pterosporus]|nr:hypothetical protein GQ54DRAFT_190962 [Martensiomyces pterosporus]